MHFQEPLCLMGCLFSSFFFLFPFKSTNNCPWILDGFILFLFYLWGDVWRIDDDVRSLWLWSICFGSTEPTLLLVVSIDSLVSRFPHCTPNSLCSDHCNFCRDSSHSTDMSHNSWSKPVIAAHHQSLHKHTAALDLNRTASLLSLSSHRTQRLKTPGYELWAFSSLMNWASNAGDRGDSLISVSRWQIFIEFWTEISLYFFAMNNRNPCTDGPCIRR